MTRTLIQMDRVQVRLQQQTVLHDVSLSLSEGEIVTIVGPNGSGKSTLLRTLIGAVSPTRGRVIRAPQLQIGYVPQSLQIDRTLPMTVARFLSLPKRSTPAATATALQTAGVGHVTDQQLGQLSGGQLQRVLLARALINQPNLLILDEATRGLDQPGSADFYRQIEQVNQQLGCAVLMVSHELHVVMSASDRVICLNGHICCEGHPEQVASAPEYRALFGDGTHGSLALYRHEHDHVHTSGSDAACEHHSNG